MSPRMITAFCTAALVVAMAFAAPAASATASISVTGMDTPTTGSLPDVKHAWSENVLPAHPTHVPALPKMPVEAPLDLDNRLGKRDEDVWLVEAHGYTLKQLRKHLAKMQGVRPADITVMPYGKYQKHHAEELWEIPESQAQGGEQWEAVVPVGMPEEQIKEMGAAKLGLKPEDLTLYHYD